MRKMINMLLAGLMVISLFTLIGCSNTAKGFGQDLENSGIAIQKALSKKENH